MCQAFVHVGFPGLTAVVRRPRYTRIAKVLLEARACLDRCRADGFDLS